MISAIEFGERHGSCPDALKWRYSLGPGATQADAWRLCQRGDWLLWQLWKGLSREQYNILRPVIDQAIKRIVARAIRHGIRSLRGVRASWATEWRRWARRWLSGEDRSESAAASAEAAAEAAAMWAASAAAEAAAEAASAAARAEVMGALAAMWAAEAAMWAAARNHELLLQARDIHREIPEWPGEEQ